MTVIGLWALGCQVIVDDFEARACEPDQPTECVHLGDDAEAQAIGCCNRAADTVYYCEGNQVKHRKCDNLTCDYDITNRVMGCVE